MTGLHVVKKGGRTYHYLRPTKAMTEFGLKRSPLSADRAEAEMQIAGIIEELKHTGDKGSATKLEHRQVLRMMQNAVARSKRSGRECEITYADVLSLLREQGYRCAVTHLPFNLKWRTGRDVARNPYAPSLDRMDTKVGYVLTNCRIVLSGVNYAMNEWGEEVFLDIAAAAVRRRNATKRGTAAVNETQTVLAGNGGKPVSP